MGQSYEIGLSEKGPDYSVGTQFRWTDLVVVSSVSVSYNNTTRPLGAKLSEDKQSFRTVGPGTDYRPHYIWLSPAALLPLHETKGVPESDRRFDSGSGAWLWAKACDYADVAGVN